MEPDINEVLILDRANLILCRNMSNNFSYFSNFFICYKLQFVYFAKKQVFFWILLADSTLKFVLL